MFQSVAQEVSDLVGLVRERQGDIVDLGMLEQIKLIKQEGAIDYRDDRFGGVNRQRSQASSLAAGKNQGLHQNRWFSLLTVDLSHEMRRECSTGK